MKSKPPKSKRERIVFVALCAAIAIVVVWYVLIDPSRGRLIGKRTEQSDAAAKLEKNAHGNGRRRQSQRFD